MASKLTTPKLLALIGGIIIIIDAIFALIRLNWLAIVALLIGLLVLDAVGSIKLGSFTVPWKGIIVLILGILALIGTGWWVGAILVIIAGILDLMGK